MRLELASFPVKDVRFSPQTSYKDGVLEVDKEELLGLVLEDKRVESADLDVAFPSEQTRIVLIRDVVEPRVKVSGPGCVFPGILGPIENVGEGRTHRLSGVTVMASAEYRPTIPTGAVAQTAGLVDMWGPGSALTPYGSTINIVLIFKLIDGVTELEAHDAIQLAELKVAHHLAATTRNKPPENVEVFELFEVDPSLPRIVYILSCVTHWPAPHSMVAFYGLSIRESLPTFVHPNEFLDGVLTADTRRGSGVHPRTWEWMNNPVIFGLLREHGKRLNFLGVILQRTRFEAEAGKQLTAACASQMARLIRTDGAIITRTGPSGNNLIDVMLTLQGCERKGVKTVLVGPEYGGNDGTEVPLVFFVPEANALVSTCSLERSIRVPAPAKVIGGIGDSQLATVLAGDEPFSPWGELTLDTQAHITSGIDYLGNMRQACKVY